MKTVMYYTLLIILMFISAAIMATITTFIPVGRFAPFLAAGAGIAVYYRKKIVFRFFDRIFKRKVKGV